MNTSTPTLDAVTESLMGALDDGPGLSDITPPVGAVLEAVGADAKLTRGETPIRDKSNPWVCSVEFEGLEPQFLVGNAGIASGVPLLFTKDSSKAMTSMTQNWFTFCWPLLIHSHARSIGKRVRAVVHRLNETPKFT